MLRHFRKYFTTQMYMYIRKKACLLNLRKICLCVLRNIAVLNLRVYIFHGVNNRICNALLSCSIGLLSVFLFPTFMGSYLSFQLQKLPSRPIGSCVRHVQSLRYCVELYNTVDVFIEIDKESR